jgi:Protein of unknown function (DUF992)/HdeA/HdeB family
MGKSLLSCAALLTLTWTSFPTASFAQSAWSQIGGLNCRLAPTVGLIVVSEQKMSCQFTPSQVGWPVQNYDGRMTRVGVDLGATTGGVLTWGVFAATTGPAFGGLDGDYVGVSGGATLGLGAGANVLLGGSNRSVALQPLSVKGMTGLNVQAGVSTLKLMSTTVAVPIEAQTIVEMRKVTCVQYLAMTPLQSKRFSAWMSGWYSYQVGKTRVDVITYQKNVENVKAWCRYHPQETVMSGLDKATAGQ